jgi:hypothetical protein
LGVVGTLGGVAACVATLDGGVIVVWSGGSIILLNIYASLLTAAIVSLETSWNGAGGGGFCMEFVRFVAAMMIRSFWVSAGVLHLVGKIPL